MAGAVGARGYGRGATPPSKAAASGPPPAPLTASGNASSPYTAVNNASVHSFRGEIMQLGQRRDGHRLRQLAASLIEQHKLDPGQLDACLLLHHVAWLGGDMNDLAEGLLQMGCDPRYADINGDSVLHYCTRGGNLRLLRTMFEMFGGRIFEVLNNSHFNLLLTAAAEASDERAYEILNMLEWFYLQGLSIESVDANGLTGLMWAAQRGSLVLVQWFLSRGASLSHRDYNGRTALLMACASGDADVVRTVCEKGGIHLLQCESLGDRDSSSALKLCWTRGHIFLSFSLRLWAWQKRVLNRLTIFNNSYAWYYWVLVFVNGAVYMSLATELLARDRARFLGPCAAFGLLLGLTQLFWLSAFASDPGYAKPNVIPDQSHRCSASLKADLQRRPVFSYRANSACHQLQQAEAEMNQLGLEMLAVNRQLNFRGGLRPPASGEGARKIAALYGQITKVRQAALRLHKKVGAERRAMCPPGYAKQVLDGNPRKICLTCRIVKPFRVHHCGDCAHCIHRFDHHCIWVDNCIGRGNQRSFLAFLFCLFTSIIYLWVLIAGYFSEVLAGGSGALDELLASPVAYFALFDGLINLLWAGFVGYLLLRTVKSMISNITFYEYLKRPTHIQKRFRRTGTVAVCWDLRDLSVAAVARNIFMFCAKRDDWDREDYPGGDGAAPTRALPPTAAHLTSLHHPYHNAGDAAHDSLAVYPAAAGDEDDAEPLDHLGVPVGGGRPFEPLLASAAPPLGHYAPINYA